MVMCLNLEVINKTSDISRHVHGTGWWVVIASSSLPHPSFILNLEDIGVGIPYGDWVLHGENEHA